MKYVGAVRRRRGSLGAAPSQPFKHGWETIILLANILELPNGKLSVMSEGQILTFRFIMNASERYELWINDIKGHSDLFLTGMIWKFERGFGPPRGG